MRAVAREPTNRPRCATSHLAPPGPNGATGQSAAPRAAAVSGLTGESASTVNPATSVVRDPLSSRDTVANRFVMN